VAQDNRFGQFVGDAVESRVQKAAKELIAKDRARTAAREREEARVAEENRTIEVAHDTYDCNNGKNDIIVETHLMHIPAHPQKNGGFEEAQEEASTVKKADADAADEEGTGDEDDSCGDDDYYDDHDALEAFRAKRLAAMKAKKARRTKNRCMGEYREIVEPEFLKTVTKNKHTVVHFYHREFKRCAIMDKRLGMVAYRHDEIKFVKLNAEKAPFFVKKLCIKVLPSVILFIDGVAIDRINGFEGLGTDDFRTRTLEKRLLDIGMLIDPSERGSYPDDDKVDSEDED